MKKVLRFHFASVAVFLLSFVTVIVAPAQTFTTLASFDETNGANPESSVVQGFDGNLYGTTVNGGASGNCTNGCGTVFKITSGGTLTTLHSFDLTDGLAPIGGLVQAADGNFYGTTEGGGANCANGCGTVFKITPEGTLTTLYSFCAQTGCTDGSFPYAGLVQATDGNFYGTAGEGGINDNGTIFKITPGGTLTTLHTFDLTDGSFPYPGLVQATNGNFYGATTYGGANGDGTVFEITSSGTLTTLHSFDSTDGAEPYGGLLQATDGSFYGTTYVGGASGNCVRGCGTFFKITAGGTLTTLHSFDSTDGSNPPAELVQATDGNFYGTTNGGGAGQNCFSGCGTIFKVTSGGTVTTLHSFDLTDGLAPIGGLVQATNGTFYGAPQDGGNLSCNSGVGCGTAFSLSVGLGPFVETLPAVGKVGSAVIILGNGLAGATSVTFSGTAATFTVASSTEIKTTVPTGATSGKVQVTTPHGTLASNGVFRVK
jgi:uncharacterized repeat protein (TIGR03803 family)